MTFVVWRILFLYYHDDRNEKGPGGGVVVLAPARTVGAPPKTPRALAPAPTPVSVVEYGSRRTLIVIGVMMAALLQTLDSTIVNVALPTIEGNIGASIDDGTWIVTGYIISNVITIPLVPFFMHRLGRRGYFALCIAGFTIASFLCGTANSLESIVLYRVIQGAFGGGLVSMSQIILRETFPPEKFATSQGLFAIALTVGPAVGPTLGGFLTDQVSWPWIFDINLVPGAIAFMIVLLFVRNPLPPQKAKFDAVGLGALALGLGAFQYLLDEGERNYWFQDPVILFAGVMSVVGITAFIIWELRGAKFPIVNLHVFKHRNVRVGTITGLAVGVVIFGPVILLAQYVQIVIGFTATLAGLLILLRAIPVILLTPIVTTLVAKRDPRLIITTGLVISAASFFALSQRMTTGSDFPSLAALMVLSGIGQSMLLVPTLYSVLATVPPAESPRVAPFLSLSVQLGGSIASALLIAFSDTRTFFHSEIFRSAITLSNGAVTNLLDQPHGLTLLNRIVQGEAVNAGFADALLSLVAVAALALIPVWLLRRPSAPAQSVDLAAE